MLGPRLVIIGYVLGSLALLVFMAHLGAGFHLVDAQASEARILHEPDPTQVAQAKPDARALDGSAATCALSAHFPERVRQWCVPITRYAQKQGLEPNLVAAVIWLESGGNPQAYSSSGAVGLMQVMPRDGLAAAFNCANGPCFADRPTTVELQDAEFNIAYGTRLLEQLLGRYGSWREALRAYGPLDAGYSYADQVLGLYRQGAK